MYKDVLRDIELYREHLAAEHPVDAFKEAVIQTKGRGSSKNSLYTASFFSQCRAVAICQVQPRLQDKFALYTGLATAVGIAIIVGTLFLNISATSAGALSLVAVLSSLRESSRPHFISWPF